MSTVMAANGDVRLAYEMRGSGEPLLLVQGLGYGRWGWEPVVDLLAEDFLVVSFDNRLDPASAQNTANYTIPGLTIVSATLGANGSTVVLTTSRQGEGVHYAINVKDVREQTGINVMTPNPTTISTRESRSTMATTLPPAAPRAIRMPISPVLRATE